MFIIYIINLSTYKHGVSLKPAIVAENERAFSIIIFYILINIS